MPKRRAGRRSRSRGTAWAMAALVLCCAGEDAGAAHEGGKKARAAGACGGRVGHRPEDFGSPFIGCCAGSPSSLRARVGPEQKMQYEKKMTGGAVMS
jgi:hypothetical protein